MVDELADTTFAHAMQLIVEAMLQTVREHFGLTDEQLLVFTRQFYDRLPALIKELKRKGYTFVSLPEMLDNR